MEHSKGAVETAFDMQVDGKHGPGRPKMTLKQLTGRKLSAIDTHDRDTWRFGVSSAMHAATQLPDGGLTVMDIACSVLPRNFITGDNVPGLLKKWGHLRKKWGH